MPKYLALYSGSDSGHQEMVKPTPEEGQAMMQAWLDWRDGAGDAIVDFGAPTMPVSEGASNLGGYSIVQADSADDLDAIFESNPHRRQGGTLEFHQILDIG